MMSESEFDTSNDCYGPLHALLGPKVMALHHTQAGADQMHQERQDPMWSYHPNLPHRQRLGAQYSPLMQPMKWPHQGMHGPLQDHIAGTAKNE